MKKSKKITITAIIAVLLTSCFRGNNIDLIKLIPVKSGREFQYVDREGKIIINPQFDEASIFRNGLALVQTSGNKPEWGFIDESGKYVIIANYKSATIFQEDLAWVISENSAPTAINSKGEVKFTLQNAEEVRLFSEGLAAFSQLTDKGVRKYGFVDKEGKVKITPQFSNSSFFSEGKCPVSNDDGKWGYIDKDGKIIINPQFDEAMPFTNGKAVVTSGGKAGVIDANGKYVINPQFTSMVNDGDLFLIEQDGKFGWTDKDGKIIINPQFRKASRFTNSDLAAVQSEDKYGFIDKQGKIVINPQFDYAFPFNGKLALVVSANKVGFINGDGKYVINPQFDDISQDFVNYAENGGTSYNSVQTDYFDVGSIISRVNMNAPEGLNFNMSYSDILTTLKKSENDLNKNNTQYQVIISQEKITNDATIDFWIVGNPWNISPNPMLGGYNYSLNASAKPTGFLYMINLIGKGAGKEDVVKTAIEKALLGYTKDTNNVDVYINDKESIKVTKGNGNRIEVYIQTKTTTGGVD